MNRTSLVALKPMRYRTRALRAGDPFECTAAEARILVGARLAQDAPAVAPPRRPVGRPERPPSGAAAGTPRDLGAEYEALAGRKPHPRWSDVRLRGEVAALKSQADAE